MLQFEASISFNTRLKLLIIYFFSSDLPTDEELISLPQVQRDQIILTKFLGSGAFGEVFEGVVYGLNHETPSLRIAIKVRKPFSVQVFLIVSHRFFGTYLINKKACCIIDSKNFSDGLNV